MDKQEVMKNRYRASMDACWALLVPMMVLSALGGGCRKTEYMPDELGEAVPYTDTVYKRLTEALQESPYTLFRQAWEKRGLDDSIAAWGRGHFTVLAIENTTMVAAGWDEEAIARGGAELDTLLLQHVLKDAVNSSQLAGKAGAFLSESMLRLGDLQWYPSSSAYFVKASLRLTDGKLSVNGRVIGSDAPIPTSQGYIWPVNVPVHTHLETAWEFLKRDGRFTLFQAILAYNDSVYNELFHQANGYYAINGAYIAQTYHRDSPKQLGMTVFEEGGKRYSYPMNTWFVPTDEAFREAGFSTLEDLKAFNEQRGLPDTVFVEYDYGGLMNQPRFYGIKGCLATDSILDYHTSWGMRLAGYLHWGSRHELLLFSNDLESGVTSNLPIATYYKELAGQGSSWPPQSMLIGTETFTYASPLVFSSSGRIGTANGYGREITIAEKDHYTLNGVIHVVDKLFYDGHE